MRRDAQRLLDIVEATTVVARYLQNLNKDDFVEGNLVQDAIFRQLTVVGEASYKISRNLKAQFPEIPWRQIAGFRHRLVHDYFGIDLDAVWKIATIELPLLAAQATFILGTEFPEETRGPAEPRSG